MRFLIYGERLLFGESLSSAFEQRNHEVLDCHADPATLLRDLHLAELDACLMDVRTSNAEVTQLIRNVRSESPELPIVVITEDEDIEKLSRFLDAGANGLCAKGDDIGEIELTLRKVQRAGVSGLPIWSHGALAIINSARPSGRSIQLTPKEQAVLNRLVRGAGTARIAAELQISGATVRTHLQHLFTKFGVHSRLALVASAVRSDAVALRQDEELPRTRGTA